MLVACKASALLCDTFGPKSFNAKLKAVSCFMWKHNYVHCATQVSKEAKAFLEKIRLLLVGPHRDIRFIFNIDQTPLFFLYESRVRLKRAERGQFSFASCQI